MGKQAEVPKEERFQRIHKLLALGSGVTCQSLAGLFGTSTKTAQRDMEELNGRVGGKIVWDRRTGSFRYTQPVTLLNQSFITGENEVTAFLIACAMMREFSSAPLADEMEALRKNLMSGKFNPGAPTQPNGSKYSFVHPRAARVDPKIWKICVSAVNACRKLDIVYKKLGAKPERRRIVPLHLRGAKGGWYLAAHCELADATRTFALSRIQEAEDTGEAFSPANYKFDAARYFRPATDIFHAGTYYPCAVRLTGWAADHAREMTFFAGQKLTEHRDGSVTMEFGTEDLFSAAEFVMSMAGAAKALKPAALVEKVKENIRALGKAHGVI
jgi:predicted DNA-binding transcriptional regulator YafY